MARIFSEITLAIPFILVNYVFINIHGVNVTEPSILDHLKSMIKGDNKTSSDPSILDKLKNMIKGANKTEKIPTGIDLVSNTFLKVHQSKAFVDKTMFIKWFMESGEKYSLITAPKRFGKSANLDMLFIFLRLQVNNKGVQLNQSKAEYYDVFTSRNLQISKYPEFIDEHFAKHPVVRMDFSKITGQNEGRFQNSLRLFLSNLYNDFRYLSKSKLISETDRHEFDLVRYKHFDMDFDEILNKGEFLTKLLFFHHGRKSIILIDDYENPVMEALMSPENNKVQAESIGRCLGSLVSQMIKENEEFVARALLTTGLKVGANCFPRPNNVKHLSIFEGSSCYKYYGFIDEEVKMLLKKFNFESDLEDVKRWYGGYSVLGTKEQIYNPFSVLNFLDKRTFGMYCTPSELTYHLSHLYTFEKMGGKMERSLDREVSIKTVYEQLTGTLSSEVKTIFLEEDISDYENNLAFEMLLETGYYTVTKQDNAGNIIIRVPNYEMKMELERFIYKTEFIETKYQLDETKGGVYIIALITLTILEENVGEFAKVVSEIFRHRLPDNAAQMSRVLAYLPYCRPDFTEIKSIEYVGRHKLDTLVFLTHGDIGIIIESNYVNSSSFAALKKIIDSKYYEMFDSNLVHPKIETRILIGLHLDEQRRCSASWLHDSMDLSKAKNVTVGLTKKSNTTELPMPMTGLGQGRSVGPTWRTTVG